MGRFTRDFREGWSYIAGEKGLLVITLYFMVSNFSGMGCSTLQLPFFKNNAALFAAWPVAVVTLYTIVSNCSVVGRFIGGLIHYKVRFPTQRKFAIAITVYLVVGTLDGVMLYLPVPLMALAFFIYGMLGVTSYNIRIAATQSYIPDTKRARFNGTFTMLCSIGSIGGSMAGGALGSVMPGAPCGAAVLSSFGHMRVSVHVPRAAPCGSHLQPGPVRKTEYGTIRRLFGKRAVALLFKREK